MDNIISFKIYLFTNDSSQPEIRRFGLLSSLVTSFNFLTARITEVFPRLTDKVFSVYWKDEEGDDVVISSDEELYIAITSMPADTKKLFIKEHSVNAAPANENFVPVIHDGVFCDGCQCNIAGYRYKCLACRNYDLCSACEQSGIHPEHPMIRISDPAYMNYISLRKLSHYLRAFIPMNIESKHHRRRSSHDGAHPDKKKRRSDKNESSPETGDESDDGCHKKHSHKKCKKPGKCPYSTVMSDVFNYFNPINFPPRGPSDFAAGDSHRQQPDPTHISYLKSVGTTIQKLLDPLGVNVEFEVRTKTDVGKEEEKNNGRKEEKKDQKQDSASTSTAGPSAPPQKEVRFNDFAETMKQRVDEITKILANQTVSNGNSNEIDGWVSYEELKRSSEESQSNSSGTTKATAPSAPVADAKESEKTQAQTAQSQNLYPDLTTPVPTNPQVRDALQKMLSMGFSNENNWLGALLEAKQGDIEAVLNTLEKKA